MPPGPPGRIPARLWRVQTPPAMPAVPRIRQNGEVVVRADPPAEGAYRPGPWYLPVTGGCLPAAASMWNWWQCGFDVVGPTRSAMVEACISAYAETVAMCPADQWRARADGGRDRVTSTALSRILRYPNAYQSISDFFLNVVWALFASGNSYALALRNSRFEVDE